MNRFIIILLTFLLIPNKTANADSAVERCAVRDCLCRVTPGRYTEVDGVTAPERRMTVFFNYDSSEIGQRQIGQIESFFNRFDDSNMNVSIIGYTDGCGSEGYNGALSQRRASSVYSIVRPEVSRASTVRTIRSGERSSRCPSSDDRRVDVIVHGRSSTATRIEKIPADVYLIDASGSMGSSWGRWNDIVNASVRHGSRVYLSIMSGCRNGQRMSDVRPQGGTEIWYSYWKVLDYMRPGETLLIVSDFDSNYTLTRSEAASIERKVIESGVNVYTTR